MSFYGAKHKHSYLNDLIIKYELCQLLSSLISELLEIKLNLYQTLILQPCL